MAATAPALAVLLCFAALCAFFRNARQRQMLLGLALVGLSVFVVLLSPLADSHSSSVGSMMKSAPRATAGVYGLQHDFIKSSSELSFAIGYDLARLTRVCASHDGNLWHQLDLPAQSWYLDSRRACTTSILVRLLSSRCWFFSPRNVREAIAQYLDAVQQTTHMAVEAEKSLHNVTTVLLHNILQHRAAVHPFHQPQLHLPELAVLTSASRAGHLWDQLDFAEGALHQTYDLFVHVNESRQLLVVGAWPSRQSMEGLRRAELDLLEFLQARLEFLSVPDRGEVGAEQVE